MGQYLPKVRRIFKQIKRTKKNLEKQVKLERKENLKEKRVIVVQAR